MTENISNANDRPRSVSRSRDAFVCVICRCNFYLPNLILSSSFVQQSSGRGGAGNIRRNSQEPAAPAPEPQVPYIIRGRERQPAVSSPERVSPFTPPFPPPPPILTYPSFFMVRPHRPVAEASETFAPPLSLGL